MKVEPVPERLEILVVPEAAAKETPLAAVELLETAPKARPSALIWSAPDPVTVAVGKVAPKLPTISVPPDTTRAEEFCKMPVIKLPAVTVVEPK